MQQVQQRFFFKEAPVKKRTCRKSAEKKEHNEYIDPRGFEYFDQLPEEIKLAIFDYFPFHDWLLQLSPVCASWRKLVTQCNRQKILDQNVFLLLGYTFIPHAAMLDIVKSYQIYGLNLEYANSAKLGELLAASKQLNWVSLTDFWKECLPPKNILPNTVSSVAFKSWTEYQALKELFPNIKELKVARAGVLKSLEHLCHPNLRILHTVVQSQGEAIDLITRIRSVAPNIETLHLQRQEQTFKRNRKVGALPTMPLEQEEQLEKLAAEMNIKLYCRNLYELIPHPNLFIESFVKQGLPYSYYTKVQDKKTLLKEACHNLALPIVKFLLENGHTTIDREYKVNPPNIFNRVLEPASGAKKKSSPANSLFSYGWQLDDKSEAMIDYLLAKGFDVNRSVNGETIFGNVEQDVLVYVLQRTQVDYKRKIDSQGNTVIHCLMRDSLLLGLEIAKKQLSKSELIEVFSIKNDDGDTPLLMAGFEQEIIEFLIDLDLGSVWDIPNASNETPLVKFVSEWRGQVNASLMNLNMLLPVVPSVPPGLVSELFSNGGNATPYVLIETLQLLAERGANLNEVIDGTPAITQFHSIVPVMRALAELGVDFNVADVKGETLLFKLAQRQDDTFSQVAELLVKEFGLDVNHVDKSGNTPLISALYNSRSERDIAKLLELGADPNYYSGKSSPLYLVSHYSDVPIVEVLLKAGADPNMKLYNETKTEVVMPMVTILNDSAEESTDLLELFVNYGADLTMKDDAGNTLLHLLTNDAHIEYLLKFLDVHETNIYGQTPLWNSSLSLNALKMMVEVDPNIVNHVAADGSTVLHFRLPLPTAKYLLSLKNIDISVVNKRGQSILHNTLPHNVMQSVFERLFKVYLRASDEMKAKIRRAFNNVDLINGCTALHFICATAQNATVVQQMVEGFELNVNPNVRELNLSLQWTNEVILYLLSIGSDPNRQSSITGNTFLHLVCGFPNNANLTRALLKHGASIDIKNLNGISPADLDPTLRTGYQFASWTADFGIGKPRRKMGKKAPRVVVARSESSSDGFSDEDVFEF